MVLTLSHYRILQKLGAGGKADVYLAEDLSLKRKVALKLMHRHLTLDSVHIQRFRNEAEWASILNHPNIVTIFEIGETEGSHFIASEFVEGETLRRRIERGPIPMREVIDIAIAVASALVAAHEIWIVHRDIKPENVMVRPDGYVKVLDFGAAKLTQRATDARLTEPGKRVGTLRYFAPEQVSGIAVDPRTDIFAFGELIYEMVTRRPPFDAENVGDLLIQITTAEPPNLSAINSDTPGELESIVSRALKKDPEERYATAKEMLEELRDLRDELVYRERSKRPFRT